MIIILNCFEFFSKKEESTPNIYQFIQFYLISLNAISRCYVIHILFQFGKNKSSNISKKKKKKKAGKSSLIS